MPPNDNDNGGGNTGDTSNNRGNQKNIKFLRLKLSERLQNEKIVKDFIFDERGYFILKLNHEYMQKTIPLQLDWNHYHKSLESFEKLMLNIKGIKDEHSRMFTETIDLNYEPLLEFRKRCEAEGEDENNQPLQKIFIRKYTANGTLALHESLVISGQPIAGLTLFTWLG